MFLYAITYHRTIRYQRCSYAALELDYSGHKQFIAPDVLASNGIIYTEQNSIRWI